MKTLLLGLILTCLTGCGFCRGFFAAIRAIDEENNRIEYEIFGVQRPAYIQTRILRELEAARAEREAAHLRSLLSFPE